MRLKEAMTKSKEQSNKLSKAESQLTTEEVLKYLNHPIVKLANKRWARHKKSFPPQQA